MEGVPYYIVNHKEGMEKDFFIAISLNVEPLDASGLQDTDPNGNKITYVLCAHDELELADKPAQPAPEPEAEEGSDDIPDAEAEDIPDEEDGEEAAPEAESVSIEEPEAEEQAEEEQAEEAVEQPKPPVDSPYPHFDVNSLPIQTMVEVVKKPLVLRAMKQTQPFTITAANGQMYRANAGDYLMYAGGNNITICDKGVFDMIYEPTKDMPIIELNEDARYNLPKDVYEHIMWLRNENDKIRAELHLKNHPIEDKDMDEIPTPKAEKGAKAMTGKAAVKAQTEMEIGSEASDVASEAPDITG